MPDPKYLSKEEIARLVLELQLQRNIVVYPEKIQLVVKLGNSYDRAHNPDYDEYIIYLVSVVVHVVVKRENFRIDHVDIGSIRNWDGVSGI